MSSELVIRADWERLDEGTPEERAAFAALSIHGDGVCLTEGIDPFVNRVRTAPLLSAYHLAEWLAWNWWRLRWEPAMSRLDWDLSHRMASIGAGYVWPNVTVVSDGARIALVAQPSRNVTGKPHFRYLGGTSLVICAREFETAVAQFVGQVRGQLRAEGVPETNLDRIWTDVAEERSNAEVAQYRKLEALLGFSPDEAPASTVRAFLDSSEALGKAATAELASEYARRGMLITFPRLEQWAQHGFDSSPQSAVRFAASQGTGEMENQPAWKIGAAAANALRKQEHLGTGPVSNQTLAELAGVPLRALLQAENSAGISFVLVQPSGGRVCLRPRWETGRRFDLARLVGDRIFAPVDDRVWPATHSFSCRQKMQRAFAAELLAPFDALHEHLLGDYSAERREDVAADWNVSEGVIRTQLLHHHCLDRNVLDGEFEVPLSHS